ncbi:hypothetical protein COCC4DRAFT_85619 [Bipolaris maydis ATCC 48331]|uniref:Uncharacterized protein n=1 Tax=Cochliobolus heterostrophus (strain C4 / ATCC 48331 / race T) TaxID=665024 RepID=N4X0A0_COCH4|nr:uncharacterized protein COCC4DRAFT_85619 [Bipolaris maydis ATCC 48331]ENH98651.1 hypothetical protein COCC4DRAFT_85619 [Bipolaris maydis ATCC 48331]
MIYSKIVVLVSVLGVVAALPNPSINRMEVKTLAFRNEVSLDSLAKRKYLVSYPEGDDKEGEPGLTKRKYLRKYLVSYPEGDDKEGEPGLTKRKYLVSYPEGDDKEGEASSV